MASLHHLAGNRLAASTSGGGRNARMLSLAGPRGRCQVDSTDCDSSGDRGGSGLDMPDIVRPLGDHCAEAPAEVTGNLSEFLCGSRWNPTEQWYITPGYSVCSELVTYRSLTRRSGTMSPVSQRVQDPSRYQLLRGAKYNRASMSRQVTIRREEGKSGATPVRSGSSEAFEETVRQECLSILVPRMPRVFDLYL
jgi:hypothetical protein